MSHDHARVDSIDALGRLRVSLCRFAEAVRVALAEADSDLSRSGIWLGQEMHTYWKDQVRRRDEEVHRARLILRRQESQTTPLGGHYSCVDERKALAKAQRRSEEAQRKLSNIARWGRKLEEEAFAYKGVAQGLSQAVEGELPVILARLDNMMAALQAYLAVSPVEMAGSPEAGWQTAWTASAGTPADEGQAIDAPPPDHKVQSPPAQDTITPEPESGPSPDDGDKP